MNCPTCSITAILISAWPGQRHAVQYEPNVFAQYRCLHGHYFETLKIFNGSRYEEYYIPFGEPKRDVRATFN
jgi:hypothetical protein